MSLLDSDDSYLDSIIDGVTIFGRSEEENKAGFQTLNASGKSKNAVELFV
jgi:hypothetical protein